jgi:negative regulator of flagellin synthesis FlgM
MDGIDTAGGASSLPIRPASTTTTSPVQASAPVAPAAATDAGAAQTTQTELTNLISLLADAAPPIDNKKVEAIQSLIAAGAYPIDPHAIAAKMLALDFPAHGGNADA